jgi:tetratricopeptide (TPR) repeat protein
MRGPIGLTAWFLGGILLITAEATGTAAEGQQSAEHFRVSSGIGATVSVATLRIPEKAWKHFAKAKAAAERNRLAESDREAQKAIEIAPDFAEAYLLRAQVEILAHSFEAAIESLKEARRVEPDVQWAGVLLAGAYNGLHRYEDARSVLGGLHGCEAQTWQAAYEGARAAIGLNDVGTALLLSALALETAPEGFPDVQLVRTNAFLRARRWLEAQGQMELYLQSKGAQEHRADVLVELAIVKQRIREDELQKVASR